MSTTKAWRCSTYSREFCPRERNCGCVNPNPVEVYVVPVTEAEYLLPGESIFAVEGRPLVVIPAPEEAS